jgi:hypothetical protein
VGDFVKRQVKAAPTDSRGGFRLAGLVMVSVVVAHDGGVRLICAGWVGRCQEAENLASLAKRFSRPGCLARFSFSAAIAHLRDILGDQTYESLARRGETMTTVAMVTYAHDQIEQARTQLEAVSK